MAENHTIPVEEVRKKLIDKVRDWKYSDEAYIGHLDNGNIEITLDTGGIHNTPLPVQVFIRYRGKIMDRYSSWEDGKEIDRIFEQVNESHYNQGVEKIRAASKQLSISP